MICAIIFDWGGVLIDDLAYPMISHIANHLRVRHEDIEIHVRGHLGSDFAKGVISESEFWKRICDALGVSQPRLDSLWTEAINACYSEKQDVLRLIDSLKARRYKLGVLSNTEPPCVKLFHMRGYPQFDTAVFSCEEGMCKPDQKIYEIALKRLGVQPYEALFIDDKEENVRGAQNVGLHTLLFANPKKMEDELEFIIRKESN